MVLGISPEASIRMEAVLGSANTDASAETVNSPLPIPFAGVIFNQDAFAFIFQVLAAVIVTLSVPPFSGKTSSSVLSPKAIA